MTSLEALRINAERHRNECASASAALQCKELWIWIWITDVERIYIPVCQWCLWLNWLNFHTFVGLLLNKPNVVGGGHLVRDCWHLKNEWRKITFFINTCVENSWTKPIVSIDALFTRILEVNKFGMVFQKEIIETGTGVALSLENNKHGMKTSNQEIAYIYETTTGFICFHWDWNRG